MRPLLAAFLPALLASCAPAAPATLTFPHEAVRIDPVCTGDTGTHGLAVSVEAPFSSGGQRRFRIVNASGAAHEVHPEFVVSNAGRCDRGWSSSNKHALQDTGTCSAPLATTLAPGQSLEMRVLPHRERAPDACTKIGLALHATVDGEPACVEMGAWLAYHPDDE